MTQDDLLRLYPSHRAQLVASLARQVGWTDAEDLANETLLRATQAVGEFREEATLSTWLHRIGTNLAIDMLRKRQRYRCVPVDEETANHEAFGQAPETRLIEQRQMSKCVQDLMNRLPAEQREVLVGADVHDRTAAEIAHLAGVSVGNVKIRLHRARRSMKDTLERHCELTLESDGVCSCVPKQKR